MPVTGKSDQSDMVTKGTVAGDMSGIAPFVMQAAILFSDAHYDMVAHTLRSEIDRPQSDLLPHVAWRMLFDLYQATGQQAKFDTLAESFSRSQHTSPPVWRDQPMMAGIQQDIVPVLRLTGEVGQASGQRTALFRRYIQDGASVCLNVVQASAIDAAGAQMVYDLLQELHSRHCLVQLAGAGVLAAILRQHIEGSSKEGSHWLLYLELLRLEQQADLFEETALAYAALFGVSPPDYDKASGMVYQPLLSAELTDVPEALFVMPPVLAADMQPVLDAIRQHAVQYPPLAIDCSGLMLASFPAASKLGDVFGAVHRASGVIALHNVSYLVGALFCVAGLERYVRMTHPRT